MQIYLFNINLFDATCSIYIILLSANVERISESNPINIVPVSSSSSKININVSMSRIDGKIHTR